MFSTPSPLRVARSGHDAVLARDKPHQRSVATSSMQGFQLPSGYVSSGATGQSQLTHGSQSQYYGGIDIATPYIDPIPHTLLCDMYMDIYSHDAVAGAIVDMFSTLPFSDFELRMPVEDPKEELRQVFEENIDRLRITTLFPAAVRERMVFGAYLSLLVYNADRKVFTDTIPFEYKNTEVQSNVLYGGDPTIVVRLAEDQRRFLVQSHLHDQEYRKNPLTDKIGPKLMELLRSGPFELDALSSLYFPNKPFTTTDMGTSSYKRILTIYFLEKIMLRGTTHMANRRQNSATHIQAGSDEWEPSPTELDDFITKLIEADRDPLGGVIATRQDVNIAEIGNPGGFWKWDDMSDTLNQRKMMALGVSESFLSGDASYNTLDHALTIFIEQLRALRGTACNQFFYRKLFPLISVLHGFTRDKYIDTTQPKKGRKKKAKETARYFARNERRFWTNEIEFDMSYVGDLIIPIIEWEKKLIPQGDSDQLDVIDRLAEKGVPFSLRTMAAAGGYSLDQLTRELENSTSLEKKIQDIKKKREKVLGPPPKPTEEFSIDPLMMGSQTVTPGIGVYGRDYPEHTSEIVGRTKTGKRKWLLDQHRQNKKANRRVIGALQRVHAAGIRSA